MASREYKFVSEPADVLKCAVCLEVAREPHQHEECGKLFCKECMHRQVWKTQVLSSLQDTGVTVLQG